MSQDRRIVSGGETFSACHTWRYRLWRYWAVGGEKVVFIVLNPSRCQSDYIMNRCSLFAHDWGYSGMFILSLFGLVENDPSLLFSAEDPVGPENDQWIMDVISREDVAEVILCWGDGGKLMDRWRAVLGMVERICPKKIRWFEMTIDGQPKHIWYVPRTAKLECKI